MSNTIENYWQKFLKETNRSPATKYYGAFPFGHTEEIATWLLKLILDGTKTATASAIPAYTVSNEAQPQVGDRSIVTDWAGKPHCIIETTAVAVIKFEDITYDICRREGEHDNLEGWQRDHVIAFEHEAAELGYEFSWDMPVLFEDFTVIYK
jgi:uncharacterized protein YhfF